MICAGGIAGGMSKTLVAPISRTTVLFQVYKAPIDDSSSQVRYMQNAAVPESYQRGVWAAITNMWQKEGLYGLFKGNGTHLIKKVPFSAIKFLSYERFKQVSDCNGRIVV